MKTSDAGKSLPVMAGKMDGSAQQRQRDYEELLKLHAEFNGDVLVSHAPGGYVDFSGLERAAQFPQDLENVTIERNVYERWRLIGSAQGLETDTQIANFLTQQYENSMKCGASPSVCSGCKVPLSSFCSKCSMPLRQLDFSIPSAVQPTLSTTQSANSGILTAQSHNHISRCLKSIAIYGCGSEHSISAVLQPTPFTTSLQLGGGSPSTQVNRGRSSGASSEMNGGSAGMKWVNENSAAPAFSWPDTNLGHDVLTASVHHSSDHSAVPVASDRVPVNMSFLETVAHGSSLKSSGTGASAQMSPLDPHSPASVTSSHLSTSFSWTEATSHDNLSTVVDRFSCEADSVGGKLPKAAGLGSCTSIQPLTVEVPLILPASSSHAVPSTSWARAGADKNSALNRCLGSHISVQSPVVNNIYVCSGSHTTIQPPTVDIRSGSRTSSVQPSIVDIHFGSQTTSVQPSTVDIHLGSHSSVQPSSVDIQPSVPLTSESAQILPWNTVSLSVQGTTSSSETSSLLHGMAGSAELQTALQVLGASELHSGLQTSSGMVVDVASGDSNVHAPLQNSSGQGVNISSQISGKVNLRTRTQKSSSTDVSVPSQISGTSEGACVTLCLQDDPCLLSPSLSWPAKTVAPNTAAQNPLLDTTTRSPNTAVQNVLFHSPSICKSTSSMELPAATLLIVRSDCQGRPKEDSLSQIIDRLSSGSVEELSHLGNKGSTRSENNPSCLLTAVSSSTQVKRLNATAKPADAVRESNITLPAVSENLAQNIRKISKCPDNLNQEEKDKTEENTGVSNGLPVSGKRHKAKSNAASKQRQTRQQFTCDHCEKTFRLQRDLKAHELTHTGETPHKCTFCDSSFSVLCNLKNHIRTHTGEKPFKCDICGKAFTEAGPLKVHKRTHSGEKPYKCSYCHMAFTNSGNLTRHERTHTGQKPYQCSLCSAGFAQPGSLKAHMRTHTGERPYKCDSCQSTFGDNSTLHKHKRNNACQSASKTAQKKGKKRMSKSTQLATSSGDSTLSDFLSTSGPETVSAALAMGQTVSTRFHPDQMTVSKELAVGQTSLFAAMITSTGNSMLSDSLCVDEQKSAFTMGHSVITQP